MWLSRDCPTVVQILVSGMEAGKRGRRFLASLTRWDGRGGFSLEPIQRVLVSLDNPQDKVPIIHVAGTNGKGSTSVMLSAIFGQEGKRVGLTISPHLNQVNERIVIDGLPVSDDLFEVSADAIRWGCEKTGESLSYHEALTAMAFFAFCEEGVELSVIEVGLGGRLDASNVIKKPLVSVITSIGLDHTDILGSSEEAIAAEKAGIIKPGSHVVVGARVSNEAFGVISNNAIGVGSSIDRFGVEFSSILTEKGEGLYSGPSSKGIVFRPSLLGEHQIENGALALRVGEYLGVSIERVAQ